MNTMGSGMSAHEWHGPQVPSQTDIIKDLHQQLMVKELQIKELREAYIVTLAYLKGATKESEWSRKAEQALSKPYSPETLRKYVADESVKLFNKHYGSGLSFQEIVNRYEKGEVH